MRELIKKGVRYVWSKAFTKELEALRSELCSAPILAWPDYTKPFIIRTDASHQGLGAVLLQCDSETGAERPLAFASRGLSPEEVKWDTRE